MTELEILIQALERIAEGVERNADEKRRHNDLLESFVKAQTNDDN